jgi:hypothetical protein
MVQNVSKCFKMFLNGSECFKMFQNVSKCFKMFQLCFNYVSKCFNYVSIMFQLCFNYVSIMFPIRFQYPERQIPMALLVLGIPQAGRSPVVVARGGHQIEGRRRRCSQSRLGSGSGFGSRSTIWEHRTGQVISVDRSRRGPTSPGCLAR